MENELFLRIVDKKYLKLQQALADLLCVEFKIHLIDDSESQPKFESILKSYREIVNLSNDILLKDLYPTINVIDFKISRVFSIHGQQMGWFIPDVSPGMISNDLSKIPTLKSYPPGACCVVDSDIATGSTKKLALKLYEGADFFAPITLKSNQDLIDIEDLALERSLIWTKEGFLPVTYLENAIFFNQRTSIPVELFSKVTSIVKSNI